MQCCRLGIISLLILLFSCEIDKTPLSLEDHNYTSHEYEWQVDTLHAPDALQVLMYSIWGTDEDNIWVVGHSDLTKYQVWHWDGQQWKSINLWFPGHPHSLEAIYGFSENDIWIVGNDIQNYPNIIHKNFIIHYNGSDWEHFDRLNSPQCLSIWGSDPSNLFVGCDSGIVLYYNGSDWEEKGTGTLSRILNIQGFSSSQVYAAGWTIDKSPHDTTFYYFFEYDGMRWNLVDRYLDYPGAPPGFFGHRLWASPDGNLYGGGDDGLYLWQNRSWLRIREGKIFSVYGTGWNNIFIGGSHNQITHYNGNYWKLFTELSASSKSIFDIWCNSKNVFAISVINNRSLIYRGTLKP